MNSRTREREKAHRKATAMASEMRSLVCGLYGCEPAHFALVDGEPRSGHRGMHAGKAGWKPTEWVPLLHREHMILDKQWDAVEGKKADLEKEREHIMNTLTRRAPDHWSRYA